MEAPRKTPVDYFANLALRGLIGLCLALPYRLRVPCMGWIVARLIAPIAGWPRRIRENVAYVMPDMPQADLRRLVRGVPDNFGRSLIEIYSGEEFRARVKDIPFSGGGVAALAEAKAAGRPVMLVTGHFGNYDAPRAALVAQGYPVGGLFRPARNDYFNDHYAAAIAALGEPMFSTDRRDLPKMIRFIRDGGMQGIVIDLNAFGGEVLDFLGKPALSAVSAAEMALKYNALLVPIYGIRQPDGLSFDIRIEAPVPHSDPITMTQALNDSLAALVRQYPDQWFWIHRRWKLPRQAN